MSVVLAWTAWLLVGIIVVRLCMRRDLVSFTDSADYFLKVLLWPIGAYFLARSGFK